MKYINKLEEWLGGTLFIAIFGILIAQILSRQVFHSPLIWSEELAKLLFVYGGYVRYQRCCEKTRTRIY